MTIDPFDPTLDIPDDYPDLLPEVQRQLGRCVLMSQRIEHCVKVLLAASKFSVSAEDLKRNPSEMFSRNLEELEKSSLGTNVRVLFEQFFQLDKAPSEDALTGPSTEALVQGNIKFFLNDVRYQSLKGDLRSAVDSRNLAVHHLRERFALDSLDGRQQALAFLSALLRTLMRIESELVSIAVRFDEYRKVMAPVLSSDSIRNAVVHGINPDGTVEWSRASIGESLEDAFKAIPHEGWCDLDQATSWILAREPEQLPGRFSCSTWKEVLVHSAFEVRPRKGGRTEFKPGPRREMLLDSAMPVELEISVQRAATDSDENSSTS